MKRKIIKSGNPAQILADRNVLKQANLKETSLHYVAEKIKINSEELIGTFVHYEKNHEKNTKKQVIRWKIHFYWSILKKIQ